MRQESFTPPPDDGKNISPISPEQKNSDEIATSEETNTDTPFTKAQERETASTISKIDLKLVFDMVMLSINNDGTKNLDIAEIIQSHVSERGDSIGIDKETIADVRQVAIELSSKIQSDIELSDEQRNKIIEHLCSPILYNHLSGKDVLTLVDNIQISSAKAGPNAQGYEGYMFYSPQDRTITISESIIDGFLETIDENGQTVKQQIDFEHMLTHELSHGVSEHMLSGEKSKEILAQTNEILLHAKEIRGSQSYHIETVFDAIQPEKIKQDYIELTQNNPRRASEISLEQFSQERNELAAKEIITDYVALYLQSNGGFDDFARVCISKTDREKLIKHLNIDIPEGESLDKMISQAISARDTSELFEENPKLKTLVKSYQRFYAIIKNSITKNSITSDFRSDDEEWEIENMLSHNLERANSFLEPNDKNSDGEGILDSIKGLLSAFDEEFNIV